MAAITADRPTYDTAWIDEEARRLGTAAPAVAGPWGDPRNARGEQVIVLSGLPAAKDAEGDELPRFYHARAAAPNGEPAVLTRAVATVETVRIGSKQMTKAVYNQLESVRIRDLVWEGEPWGWVNVCPADCALRDQERRWLERELRPYGMSLRDAKHRHVIGTLNGRLCRAKAWYLIFHRTGAVDTNHLDGNDLAWSETTQLFIAV